MKNKHITFIGYLQLSIFLLLSMQLQILLASAENIKIPAPLSDWQDWVLYDKHEISCPDSINGDKKFCVWPGKLKLYVNKKQHIIYFYQNIEVYGKSKVFLPGGEATWPQTVRLNEQEVTVLEHNKRPYLWIEPGKYKLSGELKWSGNLNFIPLSKETVLVDLFYKNNNSYEEADSLNNSKQKKVTIDSHNKLWLKQVSAPSINKIEQSNDSLEIKVFRKISDGIPLLMESYYRIKVSGQAREITIKDVIAADFVAFAYSSHLPIRLNNNNTITLQIKPGVWTFNVIARAKSQLKSIAYFSAQSSSKVDSSEKEIWVFQEDLSLQQVEATSKLSVDPAQTLMPASWKHLPAFLMQQNSVLKLDLKKRGNPTPAANNLSLKRRIWLDFSGNAMSIEDHISGEMNRNWRLDFIADILPGKVSLNKRPQLITLSEVGQAGVEVQNGKIDLLAESRIENNINSISATGWQEDFKKLDATLYMPPGWSIFHASGVDKLSSGWINKWTLLDLFQVLLISIIFYRLWGIKWGVVSLLCFILLVHRFNAPIWIWLHILLSIGLLSLVQEGKLHKFLVWYKTLSIAVLIFTLLPFWVSEIRSSIYPQLKISPYQLDVSRVNKTTNDLSLDSDEEAIVMGEDAIVPVPMVQKSYKKLETRVTQNIAKKRSPYYSSPAPRAKNLDQYDSNAKIQTGQGLPGWSFNSVKLSWSGPVSSDQMIHFYFISPRINLILSLLMLVFSALLVYRVVDVGALTGLLKNGLQQSKTMILITLVVLLGSMSLYPQVSLAQISQPVDKDQSYPPAFLLEELQKRLTKPALCHPQCALIENMHIALSDQKLILRLTVNSGTLISFPLPVDEQQLTIDKILLDDQELDHFNNIKTADPRLLSLPLEEGKHQLLIMATVHGDSLVLPLNIATYNISYNVQNWRISGIKDSQAISKQLILQKKINQATKEDKKQIKTTTRVKNIPVFVKIKRQFYFDLEWTIETTVSRLSDKSSLHSSAIVFDFPLLNEESILSDNKQFTISHDLNSSKKNTIKINLAPSQNHFRWSSRLKKSSKLLLYANENPYWIEQWEMFSNPVWHIKHRGIPPTQHLNRSKRHQPIWRPWPGESLELDIIRPEAITGNTRTITRSTRTSSYGGKLSEHQLDIDFNSSQGGQQKIVLPANAQVLALKVAGKILAIDDRQQQLDFSLAAGKQQVQIKWREKKAISSKINTSLVSLGIESVNSHLTINLPQDRWLLYTFGPSVGPVVLIWGMLVVILIIAYAVSKIPGMPLTAIQALFLSMGLAPVSLWSLLIVLLWFVIVIRRKVLTDLSPFIFNSMQIGLVIFTMLTLAVFIYTIQSGLLGFPEMHILGNSSTAYQLNWYQDRSSEQLPQVTLISLPIYWYRILMLLWALWLAFTSIRWAIWAWQNYSYGGYWKKVIWKRRAIKHLSDKSENNVESE